MSNSAGPEAASKTAEAVSDQDVALGRRAITVTNAVYGTAFLLGIAAAAYVLLNIPLDTVTPYTGRKASWPAWLFMPTPLILFGFFFIGSRFRTKPSPPISPKPRKRMYIKSAILSAGFLVSYLGAAQAHLVAGDAWPW